MHAHLCWRLGFDLIGPGKGLLPVAVVEQGAWRYWVYAGYGPCATGGCAGRERWCGAGLPVVVGSAPYGRLVWSRVGVRIFRIFRIFMGSTPSRYFRIPHRTRVQKACLIGPLPV